MRWRNGAVAAVLAAAVIASAGACAAPAVADEPTAWLDTVAVPLRTTDADEPVDDLAAVEQIVGDATVVGLGESAHGLGDQFTARHRLARYLVERMGFRTLSWEEDFGSGVAVDRYIVDGIGDPREVVGSMVAAWRSEQMLELVRWLREFNLAHPGDEVRFLGTDVTQMRQLSLDEITRFVSEVAPARVEELRSHLEPIALRGSPGRHIGWYFQQADKQSLIDHARAVRDLVAGLPGGADRDVVLRHAEAVLGFYVNYTESDPDFRDRFMADTLGWWQERTGHKVVYWAANVHVAASPSVGYSMPPTVIDAQLVPAGHHLRQHYGPGYVVIGAVFGSGEVLQGWETGSPAVFEVPAPGPDTVDATLGRATSAVYLLDLRSPAPPQVRSWLDGPATMRIIGSAYDAAADAQYTMEVGSWTEGFDAIVYVRTTSAAQLLG